MKIETKINKYKKALIKKAKEKGLYENFGQKEVMKLEAEYPTGYIGQERINMDLIRSFNDWVMEFNDKQLNEVKGNEQ